VRGLGAVPRLALHLAAAALAAGTLLADRGPLAVAVATVAVAWMVNLYNFMDGSDALAGTMGTTGFGALAIAATVAGDPALAATCAAASGACVGFLVFNLPPARLFMGDVGSTSLGLLAGTLGLLGWTRGLWSPLLPLIVFMPFVLDATATLLDRARRGCRVWEAHREHAYQTLNLSGLGHARTALAYGTLMTASALLGLVAWRTGHEAAGLAVSVVVHGALWVGVQHRLRRPAAGTARRP
ncbi:MAG: glycosyl transferase, partial [Burkholderiales bacterium]